MLYELMNYTKCHRITDYWDSHSPSIFELIVISDIYGWDLDNDIIYTGCCTTTYIYRTNKSWELCTYPTVNIWFPMNCSFLKLYDKNDNIINDETYAKEHDYEYVRKKRDEYYKILQGYKNQEDIDLYDDTIINDIINEYVRYYRPYTYDTDTNVEIGKNNFLSFVTK